MDTKLKVLIPNKTWIVEANGKKFCTINKEKKGYELYKQGNKIKISSLNELTTKFGCNLQFESRKPTPPINTKSIYGFPCNTTPVDPVYNVKKKLPIFAKSKIGHSLYCAGYYAIQFPGNWVKSFCPKLTTLESYTYLGPFTTEEQAKLAISQEKLKS